MLATNQFDVIIIGGSFSGLSAAMALGRSLRNVLVIDSGLPCNRQTPHSHNFITQDGERPQVIAEKAWAQTMKYDTVQFHQGRAVGGMKNEDGFCITTEADEVFHSKKVIFASGIVDILPDIPGFSACWGISVIHCPYCHGFEVKGVATGILANGDFAYHYAQLIRNWTKDLTVFTNGKSTLNPEQNERIIHHNIRIVEKEVDHMNHSNGHLRELVFKDGSSSEITAIYSRPDFKQHCPIPEMLGCELTELGLIKVEMTQKTTVEGVFACGDNASPMRSVANAVAAGNLAGAMANHELITEEF